MSRTPTVKAIDFCCGAGGLTRGLLDAGVSVVAGLDNDERLRKTYEHNNEPSRFIAGDLAEVEIDVLRSSLGIGEQDTTLYAACTPCQPFSTLNTAKGEDGRKSLLLEFGKIIAQRPPDFVIVENVPGLHNAFGLDIYRQFMTVLAAEGFRSESDLLDAKDFGVPQTRKRFTLVAAREHQPRLPAATTRANPATVRQRIGKYPRLAAGEQHATLPTTRRANCRHTIGASWPPCPRTAAAAATWPTPRFCCRAINATPKHIRTSSGGWRGTPLARR